MKNNFLVAITVVAALAFMGLTTWLRISGRRMPDRLPPHDGEAFSLSIDQMVKMELTNHVILLDFTQIQMDRGTYRWRCVDKRNRDEGSGNGEVFMSGPTTPSGKFGMVMRYNPYIFAGAYTTCWNSCSSTSAWVFYYPRQTTLRIMPDTDFERVDLLTHETNGPTSRVDGTR